MNALPPKDHNNPPDPLDEAISPYGDTISEAENWLDGGVVENEGQMTAVDDLIRSMKDAKKAVTAAEESATRPLYDAWKAEKARWAPTQTDIDRLIKGLVAAVDGFKRKLAAEREAERRAKEDAARKAMRAAEDAARAADATNIEAQRAAEFALEAARKAQAEAQAVQGVKGLRTYRVAAITDARACVNWIATNDNPAVKAFIDAYVAKATREGVLCIDGVKVWEERRAV